MKFKILGKYGPFAVNGGSTSGYLVKGGGKCVMLDCGSGTVSELLSDIDINDLECVVLSHLHADHIADTGVLSYAVGFLKRDKKLTVYLPYSETEEYRLIKNNSAFVTVDIAEGATFSSGGFSFEFYKTSHPVTSYGVRVTEGGRTLGYTGDSRLCDGVEKIASDSDALICHGVFLPRDFKPEKPHMSIIQGAELSARYGVKTVLSHQNFSYSDEEIEEIIKPYKNVILAKEGAEYVV